MKKQIKKSYQDKIFHIVNVLIMIAMLIIFIWPLYFVVVASFSDPIAVTTGKTLLRPVGFSLEGYKMILEYKPLWLGYANTIFYTAAGTLLNLIFSVCMAYPLSRKDFPLRKVLLPAFMFTMYFGGGLIPTYLVVKNLHMVDTRWAMIVPGLISVYNALVIRTYFMNSIPHELQEASELDGANAAQYLWKVVLPLSKPVLAVVGLYYAVGHWNDFYSALIYIYDTDLLPLQTVLRNALMAQTMVDVTLDPAEAELMFLNGLTMRYSMIIAAAIPMLCMYPFIQKHFVKGVMVGSVKG